MTILSQLSGKLNLSAEQGRMKCFFTHSKESCLKDYLLQVNADLAVVATRGKHGIEGFFSSSLADFLCKYAICDVFVMKEQIKK
jgi:hypothetical protein